MTAAFRAEGGEVPIPDLTVADLVLAQARRTPDAVAVRQWDQRLSYRELAGAAGTLAAELRTLGIGPDDRVGVCVGRRPAMVVAVLGVLLSGGCYVPLDPADPVRRVRDIAADAGVRVLVGDQAADGLGAAWGIQVLPVPAAAGTVDLDAVPACPARPAHLAHVLFTSGSTGRPKGVLTTHRNLVEFVTGCAAVTGAGPTTRSFGFSSLGFDATSMDLYVPLAFGGSVQLATEADRADPTRLRRFVAEHGVDWGFVTPAVLALLDPDALPEWRTVLCGGETVPAELAAAWSRPPRRFLNAYGPTETTVLALIGEIQGPVPPLEPVPVGRPLPNHRAYVVDDRMRPVPADVEGELVLGGPGLARGYLGSPALTAERFVPDPLSAEPGQRLYRTGDVVRGTRDGRIVFVGRRDGQAKIRGQRIEVGEVEAVLRGVPGVSQAVVEVVPGPAGLELAAFLTPADAPGRRELLEHAGDRLTPAMVPARVVPLASLPRTGSDKVDRARLRELALQAVPGLDGELPAEPRTAAEDVVAACWRRVLGVAPGRDGDFFASGGNSIAAMRLVAALRDELVRDVSVEDVFTGRTAAGIAERVAASEPLVGRELALGNPPALSSPQRRLWFLDQLAPDAAPYNIALAQRLTGPLDLPALRAALRAVSGRHDVLRWRITQSSGVPQAVREEPAEVPAPVVDLRAHLDPDAELHRRLAADAAAPLDLGRGPTWRVRVYRLGDADHVLALTLHHAVFDGWSQGVLFADLATAYAAASSGRPPALPSAPASYADYAVWRADRDRQREAADLAWWVDHLDGAPTVLDLPRDRPRPAVQTYRGDQLSAAFPADAEVAIRTLAAELGTTPASVLLAGLGELLHRLTGGADHLVASVVADRRLAAFDALVGMFVDIVPVRLRADRSGGFAEHVGRCGGELLAATAHPSAPLERIVEALGVARDLSRSPLVQVMFNVLDFAEPRLRIPGLDDTTIEVDKPGSPFDVTVYVLERDGRLAVDLLYNPDLFDRTRMDRLLTSYLLLVTELATAARTPVGAVAPGLPDSTARAYGPAAATAAAATGPEPAVPAVPTADRSTLTGTEQLVAAIWREVLGRDALAPTDNFFDVGGHSLALASVHAKLTERLGRQVPFVDLFRYPSIGALAAYLHDPADNPELDRAAERAAARRSRTARRRPNRASDTGK